MLLPITADVLVGEAERLGDDGHRFTSRQLYYAACRAVERPQPSITRGFIGLGAVLIVLGGAMLWVKTIPLSAVLAVIGVLLLLAAPLNARVERNREIRKVRDSRALAMSYLGFTVGPLAEAVRSRPDAFTALVPSDPATAAGPATAPGLAAAVAAPVPSRTTAVDPALAPGTAAGHAPVGPLVVCDRSETAELFSANAARLPDGTEVADLNGLGIDGGGELAPGVRGRRLVAIHDADPAGCGLPAALRRAGATDIVDAGLRPPASDAGLQVIEGAPARMPAGIEADLSSAEMAWLRSGRRLELATLGPREAVALVCAACPPASAGSASSS